MSKYVVVELDDFAGLVEGCYSECPEDEKIVDFAQKMKLDVKPLTPAQERAGDEEWVVVRRDRLGAIVGEGCHMSGCKASFRCGSKECKQYLNTWLTTLPEAPKGGESCGNE